MTTPMNSDEKTMLYKGEPCTRPALLCFNASGHMKDILLHGQQAFGRGMEANGSDIVVANTIISRRHGYFYVTGLQCYYYDNDSTNGTWLNGQLCEPRTPYALSDGDVLSFKARRPLWAPAELAFVFCGAYPQEGMCWDSMRLLPSYGEICVGREQGDFKLADATVSARHASFFMTEQGWSVIDHQSTNGVFLNHHRLEAPAYLKPMDVIAITRTVFVYTGEKLIIGRMPGEDLRIEAPKPEDSRAFSTPGSRLVINIEERNVWLRFKKKTLLKDISLDVEGRDMVLILGGSGAGKTTFMNAVMGYEKALGTITYNDTDIYEQYEKMKYEIGFVPQQDLLRQTDTVYDTLFNAAQMKMPSRTKASEYGSRVEEIMKLLGLEREKDSLVVKLSGGQRKRLSIATELAGDPSLFFLDEPDSGLDGIMARSLMENLRSIADLGKIVMVITHGPDRAADLFNKVIVLAKSNEDDCGHLAYYGTIKDAYDFFGTKTLEGIVKKVNRIDEGGEGLSDYYINKFRG